MTKELLLAGLAFGLFVVCPRMAGMTHIINKHSSAPLGATVLLGVLVSVPILLLMIVAFSKFGVVAALAICVATDLCAALLMKEISVRAGIETLVIAIFVILGVRIAPLVAKLISK